MKLHIKLTKDNAPAQDITAMVIDGPGSWPEIAAISNENGEISFQVETEGTYKVRLFKEDDVKTISVNTGETMVCEM